MIGKIYVDEVQDRENREEEGAGKWCFMRSAYTRNSSLMVILPIVLSQRQQILAQAQSQPPTKGEAARMKDPRVPPGPPPL